MADLYGNIPIQPQDPQKNSKPATEKLPKETDSPTSPRPARNLKKRYIFVPICMLVLFGCYYGLSSLLIPLFIQKKFPQLFRDKTGLNLTVDSVKFNPLDCSLLLLGSSINAAEDDGSTEEILDINTLFIDLDFTSLLRNGIVSDTLAIQGATLNLKRHPNNTYNLSQLFNRYKDPETEGMNFAELPFLYSLNNITIDSSSVIFNDTATGKVHRVEKLSVSLPTLANFSFNAKQYIQPRFSAIINGSPVELVSERESVLQTASESPQTRLSCSLKDIDIQLYANYLPFHLPIDILKGKADGTLQIAFLSQGKKGRHLTLDYSFQLHDSLFATVDRAAKLGAPLISIDGSLKPLTSDISINNLLLRDPVLTLTDNLSASTLDSLLQSDKNTSAKSTIPLKSPALTIALLIGDNGKVILKSKNDQKIFQPVQLSIRNYVNTLADAKTPGSKDSSFRLNGESEDDFSVFSWQGSFKNASPSGELEINNLHISQLIDFMSDNTSASASGTADVRGKLSLRRSKTEPFSYNLEQGTIVLHSIVLEENGSKWLQSPAVKISPVNLQKDTIDLGNIYLEDSRLNLSLQKMPSLLNFSAADKITHLQGVDYQGEITLAAGKDQATTPPVHLKNVHLQLNQQKKANRKKDNLAFTAEINTTGKVDAKGNISLFPLQGIADIAFNKIPATHVLPYYLPENIIFSPQTLLAGRGFLNLANKEFTGSVVISDGDFTNPTAKTSHTFQSASFTKSTVKQGFNSFAASDILLQKYRYSAPGLKVSTEKATLAGYSKVDNRLKIGSISIPKVEVELSDATPPANIYDIFNDKQSHVSIIDGNLAGNITLPANDQDSEPTSGIFDLKITDINKGGRKKDTLNFFFDFADAGSLKGSGDISINPIQGKTELQLSDFRHQLLPYFSNELASINIDAAIDGNVSVHYPEKLYSGTLQLKQGALFSEDDAEILRWQKATVGDFSYTSTPKNLNIATLVLDQPQTHLAQETNNILAEFFKQIADSSSLKDQYPSSVSFSSVTIPNVIISDGEVDYVDKRMSPPHQASISSINGKISNFHLSRSLDPIDYDIKGLYGSSPFALTGTVLPQDTTSSHSSFALSNFPLSDWKEQLHTHFDIDPGQAKVDVTLTDSSKPDEQAAYLKISSIDKTDNAKSDLNFTLAFLHDQNDSLHQNIPIKGNGTGKSLFLQAVNHFQRLIIKSKVSPYLILNPPYDNLRENTVLDFEPGEDRLTEDTISIVSQFGNLLLDRPQLKVILSATVNPTSDKEIIQNKLDKLEQERVARENKILLRKWQTQQNQKASITPAPDGTIIVEDIPEDQLMAFNPLTPEPQKVTDEMLVELGRKRLDNISAQLHNSGKMDTKRILLQQQIELKDDLDSPRVTIELDAVAK